ncbi:hypothetical protein MFC_01460 [Mesomycoplasma flocculare ATCC 27716]|nr:hypothetical protein MFC_01460 [Mesomycoplasma flocculare ATCC 27716]
MVLLALLLSLELSPSCCWNWLLKLVSILTLTVFAGAKLSGEFFRRYSKNWFWNLIEKAEGKTASVPNWVFSKSLSSS